MSAQDTTASGSWHAALTPVVSLTAVLVLAGLVAFAGSMLRYQPPLMNHGATGGDKAKGPTLVFDNAEAHSLEERDREIKVRFEQAVAMLHANQYMYALAPLKRLLELDPKMPEAYVNMGFALIGLKDYRKAQQYFESAIDLRPYQDNAYWGLAVSLENQNDLPGALGAMRTYIHLAKPNDPYVTRARSAIWEWEYRLNRGPLPKNERDWLKRRSQEWDDRNSPKRDVPSQGPKLIPISVSPID